MALNSASFKSNKGRNIKYLNKDFAQFRENLIEYSKTYFPKTYSYFNEASPGMMFIEMAAYVGDVLSYYIDDTLKESMMLYAEDKENVLALSQYLGYKPKVVSPSVVLLSVYQVVPSKGTGIDNEPDNDFLLRIKEGMLVESSAEGTIFRTTELLDFNDADDRVITVYKRDWVTNEPSQYLIKKQIKAISATVKTRTISFNSNEPFAKVDLAEDNVIDIYDVRDSDGNKWYEVPYLGQEMVYVDYPNTEQFDKDLSQFKDSVPNILKLFKTSRRFVKQINSNNTTSLVFGGGTVSNDETLIPNFKNVGLGLNSSIDKLGASFDPSNFLKNKTYGQAPTGEFTISYLIGGGVEANVPKGTITRIQNVSFDDDTTVFSPGELKTYKAAKI